MSACGFVFSARASDFYDSPAWGPVAPSVLTLRSIDPAPLTVATFRQFFRHSPQPSMRDLVKACGHPAEEWNSDVARQPDPHLSAYYGGHFFRYTLTDGSHVYVWTGEYDEAVTRADSISQSGHVAPLYLISP